MLSRKFTARERVLMIILAVLLAWGTYYLTVWSPTALSISVAQAREAEWDAMAIVEETKAKLLADMRSKLEEVGYGENALSITPEYDNAGNVIRLLDSALKNAGEYDLRFSPIRIEDKFALREIQMTFTTGDYKTAKEIILELASGPYSCDIDTFRLESAEGDGHGIGSGGIRVTLTVVYYESYSE